MNRCEYLTCSEPSIGWLATSQTPSIVWNCGGAGVSLGLPEGSGVAARRRGRPEGAGLGVAGAAVGDAWATWAGRPVVSAEV
jgi:hypothetical protein